MVISCSSFSVHCTPSTTKFNSLSKRPIATFKTKAKMATTAGGGEGSYDRAGDVKQFDASKIGVKGLVDSGLTSIPRFFVHSEETIADLKRRQASPELSNIIPTIDLSGNRAAVVEQMARASCELGFFQIVNHGIPVEVLDRMVGSIKAFHEQPTEVKARFYRRDVGPGVSFLSNIDLLHSKAASWRDTLQVKLGPQLPELEEIPEICREEVVEWNSDSSFCVDITSTKDGKFITVNSNSRTSSEVFLIDAANPLKDLKRIRKRVSGVQYFLEHHNGLFYILTNSPLAETKGWSGEDYYLVTCHVEDVQSAKWTNTILPGEDTSIQDMDIFNGHLVLFLNKRGVPMLCSVDLPINFSNKHHARLENLNPWFFPLPSSSCDIAPGSNHDFMNSVYRAVLSSPVMPDLIVDYDMSKKTFFIVKQEDVRGVSGTNGGTLDNREERVEMTEVHGWSDFSDTYCCESTEVSSHDGVSVPLTILYSREAWRKGFSPGLLHGYGAYGEVLDKSWSADRLSLLDRGWVVAFADVRGGGSDSSWHKSGSGLNKQNSINDFVSCGKFLVNEGYIHKDQLCAIGYSAGGLLVGAAMNMYPSMFRAAILKVPFLDICNTLLDPNLPLTILDYEEFGNPQKQADFESIRSYSPYDNIPQQTCLPSVLVTASFHDSRVGVWEAAKWVAKVRDSTCSRCSSSIILKTNMTRGHFGEGGRYAQCKETAYEYAFFMKVLGSKQY